MDMTLTAMAEAIREEVNETLLHHAKHFEDMEQRERELGHHERAEALKDAALHLRMSVER